MKQLTLSLGILILSLAPELLWSQGQSFCLSEGGHLSCDHPTSDKSTKFQLPPHAQLTTDGKSWVCQKGYVRNKNSCQKIRWPKHARLNTRGDNWECVEGYFRHPWDHRCKKIIIPKHAHLGPNGKSYVCADGYYRYRHRCVLD